MELRIGCRFIFDAVAATHAVVMVEPHPDEAAHVNAATFAGEPAVPSTLYTDVFANRCRRLTLPAGRSSVSFDAVATIDGEPDPLVPDARAMTPDELPDDVLVYMLPSRYCESDLLANTALSRFGAGVVDWARVQEVSDWVHEHVRFDYQASSPTHTAASVFRDGVGVCRDFTHLGIALCRALNVPARYVFGYLPDIGVENPILPMDFSAWMEVYLGGRWHTFDPRNNVRRVGRVVIARGRDAADVAMVTTFAQVALVDMTVRAEE